MQAKATFPIIVTDKLDECEVFYRRLGFQPLFTADFYRHLQVPGLPSSQIGFLAPEHHTQAKPFQPAFGGQGVIFSLEVEDAGMVRAEVEAAGLPVVFELKDEPWGQRHFALQDPSGTVIDIVQPIAVQDEGYKEGYQEVV
ncbi:VOC family protein [Rhodovibrionaceae bacterium A322]